MDSVLSISGLSSTWSCAVTAANAEIAFSWGCVHWWGTGGYDTAHDEDDNTNSIWAGCKQAPTSARPGGEGKTTTRRGERMRFGEESLVTAWHCNPTTGATLQCMWHKQQSVPIIPCYTTFYQILVFITNQTFQMFLFSIHVIRFRTLKLRSPPLPEAAGTSSPSPIGHHVRQTAC